MKFTDIINRSGRSLRTAKARTILTSLAIAVGAFTLTLTLAAGNGIRDYTDRLVANNFDPAESIVGRDKEIENSSGAPSTAPREYDESIANVSIGGSGSSVQFEQITDEDVEELRQLPFVEQVRPNYQLNARYITRDDQKRYTVGVQAYNPGQKPELVAGNVPSLGDLRVGEVVLPDDYIKLLGFKDANEALGKQVSLNVVRPFTSSALTDILSQIQQGVAPTEPAAQDKTVAYTVRAVAKRPATSITFAGLPVQVSDRDARDLYDFTKKDTPDYGKYLYAYVRVKNGAAAGVSEQAKTDLKGRGYYVQTSKDIQKTITQFVNILQILVAVFGVITVIASIFGIINTMYISVLERTREIGLMKALGMSGTDVGWLFRVEAAWIGFLGGLIGAVAATLLGLALNPWLTQQLDLGEGNSILIFDIWQIIALIAALILVAIIAGWFPSRKAARLDPIEALRTE